LIQIKEIYSLFPIFNIYFYLYFWHRHSDSFVKLIDKSPEGLSQRIYLNIMIMKGKLFM